MTCSSVRCSARVCVAARCPVRQCAAALVLPHALLRAHHPCWSPTWGVHCARSLAAVTPCARRRNCVTLAQCEAYKIKRIAFPAISCGVYGYPLDDAASVSLRTCAEYATSLKEVTFVLFGDKAMAAFSKAAEGMPDVLKPALAKTGGDAVQGRYGDAAMQDVGAEGKVAEETAGGEEGGEEGDTVRTMSAELTGDHSVQETKEAMMEQATEGKAEVEGERVQPVLP